MHPLYYLSEYSERIGLLLGKRILLRKLLKEVLNIENLKDDNIFNKYKDVKVKDSVKEIYEEVIADFNAEVKLQKKLLKGKGK